MCLFKGYGLEVMGRGGVDGGCGGPRSQRCYRPHTMQRRLCLYDRDQSAAFVVSRTKYLVASLCNLLLKISVLRFLYKNTIVLKSEKRKKCTKQFRTKCTKQFRTKCTKLANRVKNLSGMVAPGVKITGNK